MKKLISLILVAAFLCGCIPILAYAAETSSFTRQDALKLACEVFPEYEAQIRGNTPIQITSSRNADSDFLGNSVICETRMTEDGTIITYQQYSSGVATVYFGWDTLNIEASSGSGYANRKCDIVVVCNCSDEFLVVDNFTYTFVQGGYDVINSFGTTTSSTASVKDVSGSKKETASKNAYVDYSTWFTPNVEILKTDIKIAFHIEVGDESCVFSIENSKV